MNENEHVVPTPDGTGNESESENTLPPPQQTEEKTSKNKPDKIAK